MKQPITSVFDMFERECSHFPKSYVPVLTAACMGLLLISCKKESQLTVDPRPVITFLVPPASAVKSRTFSGVLQAAEGASIAFEVNGRIIGMLAREGAAYKEGDVLAVIDDSDYQLQLADAKAKHVQAEQERKRTSMLYESKNTSKSQFDAAVARETSANANLELAQNRVDNCELKMPYDGVISGISVESQNYVTAGQETMTIEGEEGLEFEIGIPADSISHIRTGMPATIEIGSLPNNQLAATVTELSTQIARNTTYPTTLTLDADDPRLRPGMDGEATLTLPNPLGDTLSIPIESVFATTDGKKYVWKTKPGPTPPLGAVQRTEVTIGKPRSHGMLEIVTGLNTGDRIVSRGVNRLEEGQEVRLPITD
jgi:RND family efflux transporter MFP subunit